MRIPVWIHIDPHWFGSLERIRIPIRIAIKSWIRIQISIDHCRSTTPRRIMANSKDAFYPTGAGAASVGVATPGSTEGGAQRVGGAKDADAHLDWSR
jgi:hypothetical protein